MVRALGLELVEDYGQNFRFRVRRRLWLGLYGQNSKRVMFRALGLELGKDYGQVLRVGARRGLRLGLSFQSQGRVKVTEKLLLKDSVQVL